MQLLRFIAPLVLVAVTAGAVAASPLSLSTTNPDPATPSFLGVVMAPSSGQPTGFESMQAERTRYDAIRYRERGRGYRSRGSSEAPAQVHVGFFDPDGGGSGSFVVGLRGGPQIDPHIQLGAMVDWVHRTENQRVIAGDPYVQGGTTITPQRVLSRATTNLFPMQLFLQVSGDDNMPVIPYGGLSGGYQALFISADDFTTGQSFDATFGGWGWQAWLGAGIPLSGQARFNGEVFVNQSQPERDVKDINGLTYREQVSADGVGMRFGLAWGF